MVSTLITASASTVVLTNARGTTSVPTVRSATGGAGVPVFTITAGALPPGLVLNSATGAITGTPTTAGVFSFTIRATDSNGCFGQYSITIVALVAVGAPTLSFVGLAILMVLLVGAGLLVINRFSI